MPVVEMVPADEQTLGWTAAEVRENYIPLLADPADNERLKNLASSKPAYLRYSLNLITKSDHSATYEFRLLKEEKEDMYWGYTRKVVAWTEKRNARTPTPPNQKLLWLPQLMVLNNPNVIAGILTQDGLIKQVWVNEAYKGPPPSSQIPGRHIWDFLLPDDARQIMEHARTALRRNVRVFEAVLNTHVRHRKLRILPMKNKEVLVYLAK